MKSAFVSSYIWFALVLSQAICHEIPNIYEFCSALMENPRGSSTSGQSPTTCQKACQGKPGKRGPAGQRGPTGAKGDQGVQGTCGNDLKERQRLFEADMKSKFDLIPKLTYCSMGMKNNEIPDESITASSFVDYRFAPYLARLDARVQFTTSSTTLSSIGSWCPNTINPGEWIQVDLGSPKSISGIVTQGRPKNHWGNQCWVKTYKISCGVTVDSLSTISENGSDKIFVGNVDRDSHVINMFPTPTTCRFIRLYPITWNTVSPWVRVCLRMDIIRGECHKMF